MPLSKLLIDEPPLIVLPSLAQAIGLEEAIVLQQIHYKLRLRDPEAREWVPCGLQTLVEWCPFLTRRAVQRIVSSLKDQGLIEVAQRGAFDRTNWLRVCYEKVLSIAPNGAIDGAKTVPSHGAKTVPWMVPKRCHLSLQEISKKEEEERERPRKRGALRCPVEFEITDDMRAWAAKECPGVNVDRATEKFRDHEFPRRRSDWRATWRNWMRNEKPDGQSRPHPARPPSQEQMEEARRAAIEANRRTIEKLGSAH